VKKFIIILLKIFTHADIIYLQLGSDKVPMKEKFKALVEKTIGKQSISRFAQKK